MVIGHDDLDPALFKLCYRIEIGYAAVDGNYKVRLFFYDLVHDLLGKAVTVLGPVRNDIADISVVASEIPYKYRSGCNAVAVVISVHKDPAVHIDSLANDIDCFAHVIIKERVMPEPALISQKMLYGLPFGYTAIPEQSIKEHISIPDLKGRR